MSAPTLINLPPPPSDPVTPSDMGPGTPNSTTTSLSALSTTAIKDGHKGHLPHHHHHHHHHATTSSASSDTSTNTLEAERADRISRLAGLERVATLRPGMGDTNLSSSPAVSNQAQQGSSSNVTQQGYFDNTPPGNQATASQNVAHMMQHAQIPRDKSTVGTASATNSVTGGPTHGTWASRDETSQSMMSGTDVGTYDGMDKMSMSGADDVDGGSSAGLSDEGNASLVGFGETAGSTVSGPISSRGLQAPGLARVGSAGHAMEGVQFAAPADVGGAGLSGTETAERIADERFRNSGLQSGRQLQGDGRALGKFAFEEK